MSIFTYHLACVVPRSFSINSRMLSSGSSNITMASSAWFTFSTISSLPSRRVSHAWRASARWGPGMSVQAPTVASKTIGPSQTLEFMGIVLDSVRMEARLPDDKLARARDLLLSFKSRLVELQSLIGTLQFACKVVVPGRTFLQRIINLTRGVPSRFHHVRLNREFSRDISMWKVFLDQWNGRSFFLDSARTPSPDLELFTDAAGSIGFGGYFRGKWFQGRWPACMHLSRERGISIEWQELFPIVVACALWFPDFSGKRLQFWCDNESVVAIINQGHSKAPRIMDLVRFLVLISMKHNFFVRARHVAGVNNGIADALSRFQEQRFRQLAPHAAPRPCTIPPSLMTLWGTRFSAMRTALYRVTLDVPTAPGKSGSCLFASRTASSTPAGTFSLPFIYCAPRSCAPVYPDIATDKQTCTSKARPCAPRSCAPVYPDIATDKQTCTSKVRRSAPRKETRVPNISLASNEGE